MGTPPPPGSFQLTVNLSAASDGTVTSSPQGINCPTNCTAKFAANATVQLTASPAQNDFFANWNGACSGTAACMVTMTSDQTVGAAFNPGEQLTVTMSGSGSGTVTSTPAGINCPATCSAAFPQNTQVTLTETPGSNAVFSSWSGACSGATSCDITLSAADSVTADFSASTTGGGGGGAAALIYVASNTSDNSGSSNVIEGFAADASGQLTPIAGSPFSFNIADMVGKGNYLFGTDGVNIFTFAIAADGSLTQAGSVNAQQYNNPNNCGGPEFLFLDHSGSTLYDLDFFSDCSNNAYQSFSIDASTGSLRYLGMTSASSPVFETGLSFLGNNSFAYGASCYQLNQQIFSFKRNNGGTLTLATKLANATPLPTAPDGQTYCPWLAAADNSNHFAVSMTPMNASFQPVGPPQLAVYTADSSGGESTNSTDQDMPQVATGAVNDMEMSTDGKFLAVGGTGLQVFQFNGANPITPLTDLLTNNAIDQVAWDKTNHLYAISNSSGQLFVFSVTASGVTQAPGSPYAITSPVDVAVVQ